MVCCWSIEGFRTGPIISYISKHSVNFFCFYFIRQRTSVITVRLVCSVLLEFTVLLLKWFLFLTAIVLVLLTLLGHSLILYFIICEEAFLISFQIVFLPDSECFLFLRVSWFICLKIM
jgi:hypothetical protein